MGSKIRSNVILNLFQDLTIEKVLRGFVQCKILKQVQHDMIMLIIITAIAHLPANAALNGFIPEATMQAANEATIAEVQAGPKSEIVRVGISNTGFSNWNYQNIKIYGTADVFVYSTDNTLVGKYSANQEIPFTYQNGTITTPYIGGASFKTDSTFKVSCPDGLLGIKGLNRASKQALYRGNFEIVKNNGSGFNVINVLEVEEYLKGVVPNEMPVRFGLEALKAQAVAARNYVLSPRTRSSVNYDVVDSVASQVYYGANTEQSFSNQAVKETEGVVALYDWNLILDQDSSTAGGYTESYANAFSGANNQFPSDNKPFLVAKPDILTQSPLNTEEAASAYYKSKPDAYDCRSPYFRWEREWSADELKQVLEQNLPTQSSTGFVKPQFSKGDKLSPLMELKVKRRGDSGKIIELEIITESQNIKIQKELVIRRLLTKNGTALPSANVVFENSQDNAGNLISIKAFGGGYGHGVGMSQFGAGFMGGEMKLPYDKILKHYYTGITLATKPVTISPEKNSVSQTFYAKDKNAILIIENKHSLSRFIVDINGKEYCFDLVTGFLGNKKLDQIDISEYIKQGRNEINFYYPTDENGKKTLRLYVELIKRDECNTIW